MEKSTKKFLSILLCIAMLMSFPVVASANTAYDETFKGTYTAPSQAKNTLISGDDARLTEWYGDRVNAGSKTYSVRQNQYGLNKDGNMIEAKEGVKYTVWLAQYGVASFKFEAPDDGTYIVLTSRNEEYTDKNDLSLWKNWIHIINSRMNLRSEQYNDYTLDKLQYKAKYAYCVYENQYKGGVFYVTAGAENDRDCVYDVEILNVKNLTQDNCPHYSSEALSEEEKGCTIIYTNKCKICDKEYTEERTYHDWDEEVQVEPEDDDENYCENEVFYKEKCSKCKELNSYTHSRHDITKKTVKLVNKEYFSDEIFCTYHCELCDDYFEKNIESPCYNSEIDEIEHDFGDNVDWDKVNCKNPMICKKCGYTIGSHDYGNVDWNEVNCKHPVKCRICKEEIGADWHETEDIEEYINSSHSCYIYRGWKCKTCGKQDLDDERVHHSAWTFVQVTPQHDNVCGTYRMYCEDCGEYITKTVTLHTGEWVCDEKEDEYVMTCTRCGTRVTLNDVYPDEVIPGGSTSGGGSTGGGGAAPAPAPTTDDSQKTEEQKPSTSTTTTTATETQKPATVKVSKTKAKKNGVVVTWKTAKDVTGYEIQLATDKKFKKNKKTVKVNKKNASKKTVKKLKSKKKYYVRIRSYKIVNGKKVYGKWSKVKAVKTK